jgi:dTMP kinase
MLVVFEGIDGCGKETQIKLLKEKRPDAVVFKYPTKHFQMLNDYLDEKLHIPPKSLFLLFLADIAHQQEEVKKALAGGKLVILDRYCLSTIAYEVNGISYAEAKKIVEGVGFLKPEMVLLLDLSPEQSQERKRKQKRLDRYEGNSDFLGRVRSNFLKLHEERFLTPNWHKIDAGRNVESVHADIMKLLR